MPRQWIALCVAMCALLLGLHTSACALTVEDVYARIMENFGKIEDLQGRLVIYGNEPDQGIEKAILNRSDNFYYRVPRLHMVENYGLKTMRIITKGDEISFRNTDTGKRQTKEHKNAAFTKYGEDPSFYERMIEYFRKHQIVEIAGALTPDQYHVTQLSPTPDNALVILRARPKDPEFFKEGHEGIDVELTVDMQRGVITNFIFRDSHSLANAITSTIQWEDIQEIASGIYFPMFIRSYLYWYTADKPVAESLAHPKVYRTHIEFKDLQVNKGVSRFKFKL